MWDLYKYRSFGTGVFLPYSFCILIFGHIGKEEDYVFFFFQWFIGFTWRREWQPIPVFLLGESHAQRRLVGYGPGVAEWGTTEAA